MLTARTRTNDGRMLILLVLSPENYKRLAPEEDKPLYVKGADLGLGFDITVITAPTDERTTLAQLQEHVDVGNVRYGDPAPPPTAPVPKNADVDHGGLPEGAMRAASEAAHAALKEHGVENPAFLLIGQEAGTQRRGLATNIENAADLLRVVLYNLEKPGGVAER